MLNAILALAFLSQTLHYWAISLYSSQVTSPCFHLFHSSFPCLSFTRSSSLQALHHLCLISCISGQILFLNRWPFNQLFRTPFFFRAVADRFFWSKPLNRPNCAFLMPRVLILLFAVLFPLDPELYHPAVTAAKNAPAFTYLTCSHLVLGLRSSRVLPLICSSTTCVRRLPKVLQEPPELLEPCCAAPPANTRVVKSPTWTRACNHQVSYSFLKKASFTSWSRSR